MPKWVKATFKVTKNSVTEFLDDNCLNVAAAIAYYTLQSVFPLVLGLIVFGSFFLQEGEARTSFINGVKGALPNLGGFDPGQIIDGLTKSAPGLLSISGVLLLWSGSGIFDQLVFGVNVAYDVKKDSRNFFLKLGIRLGLLLVLGVLIAASFSITILSQLLFSAKISLFGISPSNFSFLLPVISYILPIALMFCVFAILYKVGPDRKGNKWRYVAVGALVAALLFEVLKYGFAFYISVFNASDSYAKTYGAIGGVVLFLFYIWISAAIMLFGAEVASVLGGWKSALTGPAAEKDPGVVVEADKVDSAQGPLITGGEKARGENIPEPATQAEGKEAKPAETPKTADKGKAPQPVPAYAASTTRPTGKREPLNMVLGGVILVATFVTGIFLKSRDSKTKNLFN